MTRKRKRAGQGQPIPQPPAPQPQPQVVPAQQQQSPQPPPQPDPVPVAVPAPAPAPAPRNPLEPRQYAPLVPRPPPQPLFQPAQQRQRRPARELSRSASQGHRRAYRQQDEEEEEPIRLAGTAPLRFGIHIVLTLYLVPAAIHLVYWLLLGSDPDRCTAHFKLCLFVHYFHWILTVAIVYLTYLTIRSLLMRFNLLEHPFHPQDWIDTSIPDKVGIMLLIVYLTLFMIWRPPRNYMVDLLTLLDRLSRYQFNLLAGEE